MRLVGSWILVCWSFVTILYSCVFFCFVLFLHSEELIPKLSGKAVECCGKGPQMHHSPFSGPRYTFFQQLKYWLPQATAEFLFGHCPQPKGAASFKVLLSTQVQLTSSDQFMWVYKGPGFLSWFETILKGYPASELSVGLAEAFVLPSPTPALLPGVDLREFPVNLLQANLQLRVYFPGNPSKRGSTAGSCSLVGVLHSSTQEHVWVRIIPQSCPPFCSNSLISTFSIEFLLWVEILKFTN